MNDIPNHFKRVEQLLRYRREALAPFDSMARDTTAYDIQRGTNLLFYKAIVEEMRDIVAAHDAEFKSEVTNDNQGRNATSATANF